MPRLRPDLEAQFFIYEQDGKILTHTDNLAEASGVQFVCPLCYVNNGNQRPGVHSVICYFYGKVPDSATPGPGRWMPSGTSYDDLTFVPSPVESKVSVQLLSGCAWHGHIRNGEATLS